MQERRIRNAVGDALDYVASQDYITLAEANSFVPSPDVSQGIADLPDDTPIIIVPSPVGLDTVVLKNTKEVDFAIRCLSDAKKLNIPDSDIAATIHHEQQHTAAYRAVGFRAVHYTVKVIQEASDRIGYIPSATGLRAPKNLTKIALAATTAAPDRPSGNDQGRLRFMGYDADTFSKYVQMYNQRTGKTLPLPGSFAKK